MYCGASENATPCLEELSTVNLLGLCLLAPTASSDEPVPTTAERYKSKQEANRQLPYLERDPSVAQKFGRLISAEDIVEIKWLDIQSLRAAGRQCRIACNDTACENKLLG
jgi:hypothetical protein